MKIRSCILMLFLLGCSLVVAEASDSATAPQKLVFSNLTWPSAFIIDISEDGRASWRTGIDAGGSGYMCLSTSELFCLMLEGAWQFAIPRELVNEPRIGAKWTHDDVEFELVEIVSLRARQEDERSLVVTALNGKMETTFNFSASEGIQFVSNVLDFSDEETEEIVSSVWVNTALIQNIE